MASRIQDEPFICKSCFEGCKEMENKTIMNIKSSSPSSVAFKIDELLNRKREHFYNKTRGRRRARKGKRRRGRRRRLGHLGRQYVAVIIPTSILLYLTIAITCMTKLKPLAANYTTTLTSNEEISNMKSHQNQYHNQHKNLHHGQQQHHSNDNNNNHNYHQQQHNKRSITPSNLMRYDEDENKSEKEAQLAQVAEIMNQSAGRNLLNLSRPSVQPIAKANNDDGDLIVYEESVALGSNIKSMIQPSSFEHQINQTKAEFITNRPLNETSVKTLQTISANNSYLRQQHQSMNTGEVPNEEKSEETLVQAQQQQQQQQPNVILLANSEESALTAGKSNISSQPGMRISPSRVVPSSLNFELATREKPARQREEETTAKQRPQQLIPPETTTSVPEFVFPANNKHAESTVSPLTSTELGQSSASLNQNQSSSSAISNNFNSSDLNSNNNFYSNEHQQKQNNSSLDDTFSSDISPDILRDNQHESDKLLHQQMLYQQQKLMAKSNQQGVKNKQPKLDLSGWIPSPTRDSRSEQPLLVHHNHAPGNYQASRPIESGKMRSFERAPPVTSLLSHDLDEFVDEPPSQSFNSLSSDSSKTIFGGADYFSTGNQNELVYQSSLKPKHVSPPSLFGAPTQSINQNGKHGQTNGQAAKSSQEMWPDFEKTQTVSSKQKHQHQQQPDEFILPPQSGRFVLPLLEPPFSGQMSNQKPALGPNIAVDQTAMLNAGVGSHQPAFVSSLKAKSLSFLPRLAAKFFPYAGSTQMTSDSNNNKEVDILNQQQSYQFATHNSPANHLVVQTFGGKPLTSGITKSGTTASKLFPKSGLVKNLFSRDPLVKVPLLPLTHSARRPAKSEYQQPQNKPIAVPQSKLVLMNGQIYSVLSPIPSTGAGQMNSDKSGEAIFDHQTSDTSEFPVFEAMSIQQLMSLAAANSQQQQRGTNQHHHLSQSASSNTASTTSASSPDNSANLVRCDRPKHVIQADRTVVNHILQSQQNFVIARVPIRKYVRPDNSLISAPQAPPPPSHVYHAYPMPATHMIASTSPQAASHQTVSFNTQPFGALPSTAYAYATNQAPVFQAPAASIEVSASVPRHSIWTSLANLVSSLRYRTRPSLFTTTSAHDISAASGAVASGGSTLVAGSSPQAVFVDGSVILATARRRNQQQKRGGREGLLSDGKHQNKKPLGRLFKYGSESFGDLLSALTLKSSPESATTPTTSSLEGLPEEDGGEQREKTGRGRRRRRRGLLKRRFIWDDFPTFQNTYTSAFSTAAAAAATMANLITQQQQPHVDPMQPTMSGSYLDPLFTSSSTEQIDPMRRLLMLKTATDNEVCSPVSEYGSKIKYSCVPNHCVIMALANSTAATMVHQQHVEPAGGRSKTLSKQQQQQQQQQQQYLAKPNSPIQTEQHSSYAQDSADEHGVQVQQFDDLPQNSPMITYTHLNAYNPPPSTKLAQPQHQQYVSSTQALDALANNDSNFGGDELSQEPPELQHTNNKMRSLNLQKGFVPFPQPYGQGQASNNIPMDPKTGRLVYMHYPASTSDNGISISGQTSPSATNYQVSSSSALKTTNRPQQQSGMASLSALVPVTYGAAYIGASPTPEDLRNQEEQRRQLRLTTSRPVPSSMQKQRNLSRPSKSSQSEPSDDDPDLQDDNNYGPSLSNVREPGEFLSAVNEKLARPIPVMKKQRQHTRFRQARPHGQQQQQHMVENGSSRAENSPVEDVPSSTPRQYHQQYYHHQQQQQQQRPQQQMSNMASSGPVEHQSRDAENGSSQKKRRRANNPNNQGNRQYYTAQMAAARLTPSTGDLRQVWVAAKKPTGPIENGYNKETGNSPNAASENEEEDDDDEETTSQTDEDQSGPPEDDEGKEKQSQLQSPGMRSRQQNFQVLLSTLPPPPLPNYTDQKQQEQHQAQHQTQQSQNRQHSRQYVVDGRQPAQYNSAGINVSQPIPVVNGRLIYPSQQQVVRERKTRQHDGPNLRLQSTTNAPPPMRYGLRQSTPLPAPEKADEDLMMPPTVSPNDDDSGSNQEPGSNTTACDCNGQSRNSSDGISGTPTVDSNENESGNELEFRLRNENSSASRGLDKLKTLSSGRESRPHPRRNPTTLRPSAQRASETSSSRLRSENKVQDSSRSPISTTDSTYPKDRRQTQTSNSSGHNASIADNNQQTNQAAASYVTKRPFNLRNTTYKNLQIRENAALLPSVGQPSSPMNLAEANGFPQHQNNIRGGDISTTTASSSSSPQQPNLQQHHVDFSNNGNSPLNLTLNHDNSGNSDSHTYKYDDNQANNHTHFDDGGTFNGGSQDQLVKHFITYNEPEVRSHINTNSPAVSAAVNLVPPPSVLGGSSSSGSSELSPEMGVSSGERFHELTNDVDDKLTGRRPLGGGYSNGNGGNYSDGNNSNTSDIDDTTDINRQRGGVFYHPASVNDIVAQAKNGDILRTLTNSSFSNQASLRNNEETSGSIVVKDLRLRPNETSHSVDSTKTTTSTSTTTMKPPSLDDDSEDEDNKEVIPHQYQIQVRWSNTSSGEVGSVPEAAGTAGTARAASMRQAKKVGGVHPMQHKIILNGSGEGEKELELDRMKERVRDRLFEHREEEHWHDKKYLKAGKKHKLVAGKWVVVPMQTSNQMLDYGPHAHERETPIKNQLSNEPSDEETVRHFAIPTPNFRQSSKFVDWILRDVNMNEEPGEPNMGHSSASASASAPTSTMATTTTTTTSQTS